MAIPIAHGALVVTSISAPNPVLLALAQGALDRNVRFIVIGDSKSPKTFELEGCDFYSIESQLSLPFQYAKICHQKSYTRKNIGYLLAIAAKSKFIVETDDDNYPGQDFWNARSPDVTGARATNPRDLFGAILKVGPWVAIGVAATALGNYGLRLIRFTYLLKNLGLHVPLLTRTMIYIAGFSMTATPGKLGEFVRMWFFKRQFGFSYRRTLPIAVADRADDVFAATVLCVISAGTFMGYLLPATIIGIVMATAALLLMRADFLLTIVNTLYRMTRQKPRLFAKMRQTIRGTATLFRPAPLAVGIILGCAGWFMESLGFLMCASVFNNMHVVQAVFIFTFANLVGALTFLPGGVGGTEVTMITLLAALHFRFEDAAAVVLVVRVGTLWFGIGCGYLALVVNMRRGLSTSVV